MNARPALFEGREEPKMRDWSLPGGPYGCLMLFYLFDS